jgi:hypothetical protein
MLRVRKLMYLVVRASVSVKWMHGKLLPDG